MTSPSHTNHPVEPWVPFQCGLAKMAAQGQCLSERHLLLPRVRYLHCLGGPPLPDIRRSPAPLHGHLHLHPDPALLVEVPRKLLRRECHQRVPRRKLGGLLCQNRPSAGLQPQNLHDQRPQGHGACLRPASPAPPPAHAASLLRVSLPAGPVWQTQPQFLRHPRHPLLLPGLGLIVVLVPGAFPYSVLPASVAGWSPGGPARVACTRPGEREVQWLLYPPLHGLRASSSL